MQDKLHKVVVIGAGMAGSEAAYFLAQKGVKVVLLESKRKKRNPAQKSSQFAELVCTNSLKSTQENTPHGLLKKEMDYFDSLILACAKQAQIPAGSALAVDREKFSKIVTETLENHPNIEVRDMVVEDPMELKKVFEANAVILATGPLTHPALEQWIQTNISADDFYFYDAIAPVVDADSLDMEKLYYKDRYADPDKEADYLNIPLDKEQYLRFIEGLKTAEKVQPKNFEEEKFFEACLPIDLMAQRGDDTARFSCMKPVGLEKPDGSMAYAVVQLRKENLLGSAYNLVGFQTRITYPEQKRVFRLLPGMENAEFIHLGSVHRNSFLHAKKHLNWDMSSKKIPDLYFAGQITGVEGYTESASSGLYVAYQLWQKLQGKNTREFPVQTAIGALVNYVMTTERPVPSNINFGLLPTVELSKAQRKSRDRKKIKKQLIVERANTVFAGFIS